MNGKSLFPCLKNRFLRLRRERKVRAAEFGCKSVPEKGSQGLPAPTGAEQDVDPRAPPKPRHG